MSVPDTNIWSDYDFTKIPFKKLVGLGQISMLNQDIFCVSWLLGRYCNYQCSYCWPYASSQTRDHRPTQLLLNTLAEIKKQARQRSFNSFHFSFSGGEPTLHKGYLQLLSTYNSDQENCNYQSVHMTTNLSPGMAWLKKYLCATTQLNRRSITASYHAEFADLNAFTDKLLFLQENKVRVTINMVMIPENFELLWERAMFFHNEGINVTLKPQSNKTATAVVDGYSRDQLKILQQGMPQRETLSKKSTPIMQVKLQDQQGREWYMDQAERFNAFNFNNFEGWECSSGFRSIIIREPDGSVKRSYSCTDKPLGYIDRGFQLFNRPQKCQSPACVSSADSKIPKRKENVAFPLWPGDNTYMGNS